MKDVACLVIVSALVGTLITACTTTTSPPPAAARSVEPMASPPQTTSEPLAAPANASVEGQSSTELPARLTLEDISPAVAAISPRVRKECWQPALDARPADAPLTARVDTHVEIAPSGSVATVRAEGAPDAYRTLDQCVSDVVRSMNFRPTRLATQVNIPFIFEGK